ncbi:MAG: hypothetical protein LIR35_00310 [Bacteroidota bacterium]|nr:hypothetical protein [Bacteroidota bacterium]
MTETTKKRRFRGLKAVLGVIVGLWVLLIIALQIVLDSSFLTNTANKYAAEFIDGNLRFGNISASVFKSFPNLNLTVEDATITYPHEKFAAYDTIGVQGHLREEGRGEPEDTLASFRNLTVSVNYLSLLRGCINVRHLYLDKPRIFLHQYDSTAANWDIFLSEEEAAKDSSTLSLPDIRITHAALTGDPHIVFTSETDAYRLDITRLDLKDKDKTYELGLTADTFLAIADLGRAKLPLELDAKISFPGNGYNDISLRELKLKAAMLEMNGEADVRMAEDSTYIRAEASIDEIPVKEVLDYFAGILPKELRGFNTDAKISVTALCDGNYVKADGRLPELVAQIFIPKSSVSYSGFDYNGRLGMDINAQTDSYGNLGVSVDDVDISLAGLSLTGSGVVEDALSDDPLIEVALKAGADLDEMEEFMPEGMRASGKVDAEVSGFILMSDLSPYNFSRADLEGYVRSKGITVEDDADTLVAKISNADIKIAKFKSEDLKLGAKVLGLKGTVESIDATYGTSTFIRGAGINFTAQNAAKAISEEFGHEVHPIVGTVYARDLTMSGIDSLTIGVNNTSNYFRYSNQKQNKSTAPILSISSKNGGIFMRQGVNRVGLNDAGFSATAVMNGARNSQRRKHFLDSLQRVYPDVPKDSLFAYLMARRRTEKLPDYLQEKDFRKSDLDIRVDENLANYVRNWSLNGKMEIKDGYLITPYFPLRNTIENVGGTFNNNEIKLDNFTMRSGQSDISAKGKLSGLRHALTRGTTITLDLDVTSDRLHANELLWAYDTGSRYNPGKAAPDSSVSDEEYMDSIESDSLATSTSSLLVLPSNLKTNIRLEGKNIIYSDLNIDWFVSEITMKHRCLQIINTVAESNMGDIYFEGFYATKTKKDLTAGFDLNLVDITADKVITLIPAADSLIPMLKTFKGMLDCELAATTALDTNMNFITPSINGVLKIKGKDLSVEQDGALRKITKLLMFKNKKTGYIDKMSVQGIISNNTLEVFPFILGIDRYTLAMSGTQSFDQSFKYHVSVLKSPLPFRFGINLWGNFDDWKYRLGKAKYKNENVPVFTTEIDNMHVNLIGSIHNIFTKGVELALQQNQSAKNEIDAKKTSMGYDATSGSENLSTEEMEQMEAARTEMEEEEKAQEEENAEGEEKAEGEENAEPENKQENEQ